MLVWLKNLDLSGTGSKKILLCCTLFLFSYSMLIYAKTLGNDFVWDSTGVILEDPMIRNFGNIPKFFMEPLVLGTTGDVGEGLKLGALKYYRPLLSSLHTVEFFLFGESPAGYKAVNLFLNGIVVVLGFLVVRKLTGDVLVSFLSTLLYASLPARAEAVYWVYSDSYILAALFALLAFGSYLSHNKKRAALFFVVGLFFQEGIVVLPFILLMYEMTRKDPPSVSQRFIGVSLFGAISMVYLVARHLIVGALPTGSLSPLSLLSAVGFQCWGHLRIFFWQDASATVYLYEQGMFASGRPAFWWGIVSLFCFSGVAIWLWRSRKDLFFWLMWYVGWLAVTFNVGAYNSYLMAEKSVYLAALGMAVLIASLLTHWRPMRHFGVGVVVVIVLANSVQTYARAASWVDTATYIDAVLKFQPGFDLALFEGGKIAYAQKRYAASVRYYKRGLQVRPELTNAMGGYYAESVIRYSQQLAETGDLDQALLALQEATRLVPDNSNIQNSLGVVYYLQGKRAEAISRWQLALKFDPANREALNNLNMFRTVQ
jgi:tetratricopeptide (TPR) repeat protein